MEYKENQDTLQDTASPSPVGRKSGNDKYPTHDGQNYINEVLLLDLPWSLRSLELTHNAWNLTISAYLYMYFPRCIRVHF